MKILHLVGAKVWGGGEQYVYNICKEALKRGHQTFIIVDKDQKDIAKRYEEIATVYLMNLRGLGGLRAFCSIQTLINKEKIYNLNCHSGSLASLCGLLKQKNYNIQLTIFRHNLLPNKNDYYHLWLQKQADAFICVSKAVYELQLATIAPKYKDKVKLVYSGIDTERFPKMSIQKHNDVFIVGYAGRLVENKGVFVLLDACKVLHDEGMKLKVILVGTAEKGFDEQLNYKIHENNMETYVEVLSFQQNLNVFYRSLDVFVLPSIVREAFGLVLCEAMYCEIPVISTDSGAQREIIKDGMNGFIIPSNDIEKLSSTIKNIAENREEMMAIAKNGKDTVLEKFTLEQCFNGIEKEYLR